MRNAERTPIGVDLGEYNLYTASAVAHCGSYRICGALVCARLDYLRKQVSRLLAGEATREQIESYVSSQHDWLCETIDDAAGAICASASGCDQPVLVTEDSHYEPDLWAWLTDPNAHRDTAWLLPTAHRRLRTGQRCAYTPAVTGHPRAFVTDGGSYCRT